MVGCLNGLGGVPISEEQLSCLLKAQLSPSPAFDISWHVKIMPINCTVMWCQDGSRLSLYILMGQTKKHNNPAVCLAWGLVDSAHCCRWPGRRSAVQNGETFPKHFCNRSTLCYPSWASVMKVKNTGPWIRCIQYFLKNTNVTQLNESAPSSDHG